MKLSEFVRRVKGEKRPLPPSASKALNAFVEGEKPAPSSKKVKALKEVLFGGSTPRAEKAIALLEQGTPTAKKRKRRKAKVNQRFLEHERTHARHGKTKGGFWLFEGVIAQSDAVSTPGLLRNVKILGTKSKNRRRYSEAAMRKALGLYENCKVNLNHPESNPNAPRSVNDRFGKLVNVRLAADGIRGDLKYNPDHVFAKTLLWFAENDADCLGLSHNAVGKGETLDGVFIVNEIVSVRSVDLVADAATNESLFS